LSCSNKETISLLETSEQLIKAPYLQTEAKHPKIYLKRLCNMNKLVFINKW